MLDIRYIVGSLIITVAVVAFAIRVLMPTNTATTATATLKPRIEPSRITEQPAPDAPKQVVVPPAAPKQQATAPAPTPKQTTAPATEITGSVAEQPKPAPAPKRIVQPKKKEEPEFQWPFFRGFNQNWQQN